MNIKTEMPTEFSVQRAGAHVTVDMTKLPESTIANLIAMALVNKIGDAAAGALASQGLAKGDEPTEAQAKAMAEWAREKMTAVVESLYAGEWSARRASGESDEHAAYRAFLRSIIRAKINANAATKVAYKASEDKTAFVDAIFDKQPDDKKALLVKEAKRLADAERAAKAASDIDL
jgi:hypothetical protein